MTRARAVAVGVATVATVALVVFGVLGLRAAPRLRYRTASSASACASDSDSSWVRGGEYCLFTRAYRSNDAGDHPDLVVVLHGDAPFANPGYQYAFAKQVAKAATNVIVVAIVRPGYTDDGGNRSSGRRGLAMGDNYTAAVVDGISDAILRLRVRYHTARVLLVGHSGGAALGALLVGRHPALLDGALLVSCPCDLDPWRRHMADLQHDPLWRVPMPGLSPLATIPASRSGTTVRMLVGGRDDVAPPALTARYAAALAKTETRVTVDTLPGADHEILNDPRTVDAVRELLDTIRR